ncbi:MBL fold metallo-hydrolase [Chloroflexota bacterium]
MRVRFWGVRGTIPVPGPSTVRTGGNTSCVEIETPDQDVIILDAGTGIRLLGLDLVQRCGNQLNATLLFSHTHWDHIQGLPFFAPTRLRDNRLLILGHHRVDRQLKQVLASQMSDAYLPFSLEDLDAEFLFEEIQDGERVVIGTQTTVVPWRLSHPGGVCGYRVACQGKVIVYATDVSHPVDGLDPRVVELARDADLLIHDAQFTPQEKEERPHWGHSSWTEAIHVAQEANVRQLALFHHDPMRTDDELGEIEREAQAVFPGSFVAREGIESVL